MCDHTALAKLELLPDDGQVQWICECGRAPLVSSELTQEQIIGFMQAIDRSRMLIEMLNDQGCW
jgi:hypothetical protein